MSVWPPPSGLLSQPPPREQGPDPLPLFICILLEEQGLRKFLPIAWVVDNCRGQPRRFLSAGERPKLWEETWGPGRGVRTPSLLEQVGMGGFVSVGNRAELWGINETWYKL